MILFASIAFVFAALPTVLSLRARRYRQALSVFLLCVVTPVVVGTIASLMADPQDVGIDGRLLAQAAVGLTAFLVTAVLFPLFCASVLWELGKFKVASK